MPSAEFTAAAEEVKKLSKEPSNDEKLQVYSLYKVIKKRLEVFYSGLDP